MDLQNISELFQMLYSQERHKEKNVKHETCVKFTLVTKCILLNTYSSSFGAVMFTIKQKSLKHRNVRRVPQCGEISFCKLKCSWKLLQKLPHAV